MTMSHLALNFVMQPARRKEMARDRSSIRLGDKLKQEPRTSHPGETAAGCHCKGLGRKSSHTLADERLHPWMPSRKDICQFSKSSG